MSGIVHVGLDDTDAGESIGTGALARELAAELERLGVGRVEGITRHQLLVHPSIPYTSHNSAACLAVSGSPAALAEAAARFVSAHLHEGADPGLCIAAEAAALSAFGRRCQTEVVSREEAEAAARSTGAILRPLGGTGGGVIGAAAAAGLRASGNDGRFLSLPGIRAARGRLRVADLLRVTAVASVAAEDGRLLGDDEVVVVEEGGVRPDLRDGRAVLIVRPKPDGTYEPRPRRRGEDA